MPAQGALGSEKERTVLCERSSLFSYAGTHNDSAVVLAEAIAGTVEEFADLMNEKAKKLGCQNTHFVTPNGLDGEDEDGIHETTAEDLAADYAILYYGIGRTGEIS